MRAHGDGAHVASTSSTTGRSLKRHESVRRCGLRRAGGRTRTRGRMVARLNARSAFRRRGDGSAQLQAAHDRNARRHGAGFANQILKEAADGARSEAERLLIRLLRHARISGWKANYPVCGYIVDVAFPKQKVAVEVDGWAFHTDRRLSERPQAAEPDRVERLAGAAVHVAGPDGVPAARDRRNRASSWTTTMSHAANAIQKNTSETHVSQRQPVSTAMA